MEMTGEQIILLPQNRVWDALNDPQVLKACIPGCESITQLGENQYAIMMTAAVGPVKAKFNGKLRLSDIDAPNAYSLAFEGSGGAAGFGKGGARVSLAPASGGTGTKLVYQASAQVGGKLAQVGARLIDGVAKKMAEEFFARFNATLVPAPEPAPAAAAAVVGAGTVPAFRLSPLWVSLAALALTLLAVALAT